MNTNEPTGRRRLYAIVLAGGQGGRLQPLTRRLVGSAMPKQFLPLVTPRSLLQETQARLEKNLKPLKTFVVTAKTWASLAQRQLHMFESVRVVSQPEDRGTCAGLLLALCHVLAEDPEAEVIVTPSDHHFDNARALRQAMNSARGAIANAPNRICLLGVRDDSAATDPALSSDGATVSNSVFRVDQRGLHLAADVPAWERTDGSWNTTAFAARASTLWSTVARHSPKLAALMHPLVQHVHHREGLQFVQELYSQLPTVDFNEQVLREARNLMMCPIHQAGWFECETPQRLFDWLRRSPHSHSPFHQLLEEDRAA